MRKLGVVGAFAVVLLAGCSSAGASESTPTPTETENPNTAACTDFAALSLTVPDKINDSSGNANDMWEALRVEFDEVALTADGTVQDRMLELTADWPKLFDVAVMKDFDDYNRKLEAVERACAADDAVVDVGTLTT